MARYFVSYAYFGQRGTQGFGNIEVERSYPIAGTADITELTQHITDALRRATTQPSLTISIINWREFEQDIERRAIDPTRPDNVINLFPGD